MDVGFRVLVFIPGCNFHCITISRTSGAGDILQMRYVLVHSPLVGPATWTPVAERIIESGGSVTVPSLLGIGEADAPRWRYAVDRVTSSLLDCRESLVLVGHSGAGALLPVIGEALQDRTSSHVFVDAILPPISGELSVDEPFLSHLRSLATGGRLPPWSRWWGDDTMREQIETELPLAYFEEPIPVPEGWDRVPAGYIHFSGAYEVASQEAAERGFAVEHVPGGHLHGVVEPQTVAERIVVVAKRLALERCQGAYKPL